MAHLIERLPDVHKCLGFVLSTMYSQVWWYMLMIPAFQHLEERGRRSSRPALAI